MPGTPLRPILQRFAFDCVETTVASRAAVRRPEFRSLGLTDAALLEVQDDDSLLLTDDLYVASVSAGRRAIDFSHLRVA
ncbi:MULTISPECIES: hypothetical protein [Methylobacterium]|uniref:hypothetical protein n=1 Tax=Methylobacterium TaxID=407 RepID=UPI0013E9B01F|nr:hypothetical protein [Methylobacterium sp. DB0501]NGM34296.1 hypothetical protein [Methylobacterium sp. DB0501]